MLTGHSIHLFQAFGAIYEHNLALLHVHKRARAIVCTFYSLTIPLNNAHTHIMNSEHTHTHNIYISKVIHTRKASCLPTNSIWITLYWYRDPFAHKLFIMDFWYECGDFDVQHTIQFCLKLKLIFSFVFLSFCFLFILQKKNEWKKWPILLMRDFQQFGVFNHVFKQSYVSKIRCWLINNNSAESTSYWNWKKER